MFWRLLQGSIIFVVVALIPWWPTPPRFDIPYRTGRCMAYLVTRALRRLFRRVKAMVPPPCLARGRQYLLVSRRYALLTFKTAVRALGALLVAAIPLAIFLSNDYWAWAPNSYVAAAIAFAVACLVPLGRCGWYALTQGKPSLFYLFFGRVSGEFEPSDYSFAVYNVTFVAVFAALAYLNLPSWIWLLTLYVLFFLSAYIITDAVTSFRRRWRRTIA